MLLLYRRKHSHLMAQVFTGTLGSPIVLAILAIYTSHIYHLTKLEMDIILKNRFRELC